MKVLILGFTKLKFMPYMNFYLSCIDASAHEIHIVYWNRDLKDEDISKFQHHFLHEFKMYQEDDVAKSSKIASFLNYRRFVCNILDEIKFDKIIVLHTLPGILLLDRLKQQKNRYILDYRDSTYEYFLPFKYLIAKLVQWSNITFVSSDAFRRYLPRKYSDKILTSHNILLDSLKHVNDKELFGVPSKKMRIAFWGFIRHEDINIQLISLVSKDSRFELHYYGREQQVAKNLKKYVADNRITNVFFHGEYRPEERYDFIRYTDCIHNLYFDNNTKYAMGNKYYDGIIFRIPQVCMPDSFMGEMCRTSYVGVELNPFENNFLDNLYDYLKNINYSRFKSCCEKEVIRVMSEYELGVSVVKRFVSDSYEI